MKGPNSAATEALLVDILNLVDDANRIILRGREEFFDPEDHTLRLAARTIVIDLQTATSNLPQQFRDRHPDVPWHEARELENFLAFDYATTDYEEVWDALVRQLPRMMAQFAKDRSLAL